MFACTESGLLSSNLDCYLPAMETETSYLTSWFLQVCSQGARPVSGPVSRTLRCWSIDLTLSSRVCKLDLDVTKNQPANAGDIRGTGLIPGWERSPGGGHGNPLQYSCLENPKHRGTWRATVHKVTQSRTWLKRLSSHTCVSSLFNRPLISLDCTWTGPLSLSSSTAQ